MFTFMYYAFKREDSSLKERPKDMPSAVIFLPRGSFPKGKIFLHCYLFNLVCLFQGPWIVKQSVGKKACLVGQALEINYFQGKNYIEVGA